MRCFLHKWSKWGPAEIGEVVDSVGRAKGYYVRQIRSCTKCGRVDIRIQKTVE